MSLLRERLAAALARPAGPSSDFDLNPEAPPPAGALRDDPRIARAYLGAHAA